MPLRGGAAEVTDRPTLRSIHDQLTTRFMNGH